MATWKSLEVARSGPRIDWSGAKSGNLLPSTRLFLCWINYLKRLVWNFFFLNKSFFKCTLDCSYLSLLLPPGSTVCITFASILVGLLSTSFEREVLSFFPASLFPRKDITFGKSWIWTTLGPPRYALTTRPRLLKLYVFKIKLPLNTLRYAHHFNWLCSINFARGLYNKIFMDFLFIGKEKFLDLVYHKTFFYEIRRKLLIFLFI